MVATKLWEMTNKGKEWAYGPPSGGTQDHPAQIPTDDSASSSGAYYYYAYARDSMQSAAESTYSSLAQMLSNIYTPTTPSSFPTEGISSPEDSDDSILSPRAAGRRSSTRLSSNDISWMFMNPYNSVRGRHTHPSSMSAVRSLLSLVPVEEGASWNRWADAIRETPHEAGESSFEFRPHHALEHSWSEHDESSRYIRTKNSVSASETASQLAEGTIRALRDLELKEAMELHIALRYWSDRWERPVLSWLEAGPMVWFSRDGYKHQSVGERVAQIQAVLARRCSAIGELQQHLLRAGWQRGVAQWGVLGQGGQWAAVAGFDGTTVEEFGATESKVPLRRQVSSDVSEARPIFRRQSSSDVNENQLTYSKVPEKVATVDHEQLELHKSSRIGLNDPKAKHRQSYSANIFVRKRDGGGIFVDDPAFLAEWSVDTIRLVRHHLFRAANGMVELPYETNWRKEIVADAGDKDGQLIVAPGSDTLGNETPQWACIMDRQSSVDVRASFSEKEQEIIDGKQLCITDLPLMVSEVGELLDVMEDVMALQTRRRLDRLREPGWVRRNWYVLATAGPTFTYLLFQIVTRGHAKRYLSLVSQRISSFFRERVMDPLVSIFNEIWKGRESFSDKKARTEAIETLKVMIRSWLDETFPTMPESQRIAMAESMDMSLIERKKEESMKTFYEINNVVRMSFIEMQYMKKEMMNALHAMDEMMSANDINMNLAAITPVLLLAYIQSRIFKFLYYALLKLGKSREETYSSFRDIITDIERLLVMRDNPPTSPPLKSEEGSTLKDLEPIRPCVLGSDDLGMLMLLIHECRNILWQDRRRFSPEIIKSVSEDLAELAGERGAVSVQQQLQIVNRMCRAYPFLKVISTGHTFKYSSFRPE